MQDYVQIDFLMFKTIDIEELLKWTPSTYCNIIYGVLKTNIYLYKYDNISLVMKNKNKLFFSAKVMEIIL